MRPQRADCLYTQSVLEIHSLPIPKPSSGQVLIRIRAFGLNRSELFTRQGHSPSVTFPRVLGIEATGIIAACPDNSFSKGDVVVTAMGGMGRDFDGGYAEYTVVPVKQAIKIDSSVKIGAPDGKLSWATLGAMPEMYQTAYGSIFKSLRLQPGERLLVRGGTTSVGLAATGLAKAHGCYVAGTSRKESAKQLIADFGADEFILDDGNIAAQYSNNKFDKVLELIGTKTLRDSLLCTKVGGIVCNTGIVGNAWTLQNLNPMELIPSGVCLTVYAGGSEDVLATPFAELVQLVAEGKMKVPVGKVMGLEEIVEAHELMESNTAGGKVVIVVDGET